MMPHFILIRKTKASVIMSLTYVQCSKEEVEEEWRGRGKEEKSVYGIKGYNEMHEGRNTRTT